MSFLCNDLIAMDDFGPFVHYLILEMCIFPDNSMGQYNTVLNDCTGLDLTATTDNRVFYGSLDHAAIGDNGILDSCAFQVLGRAGIVGSCVDRPFRIEQTFCSFDIDQRNIGIVITVEISANNPRP